jgi:hypothetical protein
MCGIFGYVSTTEIPITNLNRLVDHARQRGRDSSGIVSLSKGGYEVRRADYDISQLVKRYGTIRSNVLFGHSRLITNGLSDNQPVIRGNIVVVHNGIIVNEDEIWQSLPLERRYQIDSEVIVAIAEDHLAKNKSIETLAAEIISRCKGVVACALAIPSMGKLLLFSNNGSLYAGKLGEANFYFSSESYPLTQLGCQEIVQIRGTSKIIDIPSGEITNQTNENLRTENLIPPLRHISSEEKLLKFRTPVFRRCSKCILPETMPFIHFDAAGVCNYCKNYRLRNVPKPREELFKLVEPYRRKGALDCIVPFSGGRDSCYGLHLIVNELKMNPVTYTYDWGMVTDLGRRNISRMCSQLGVENILVAADITQKRKNIAMNLKAWLKAPNLGMISILTAGDKHFFRHVETVKKQTGIDLNLWGVNPLEVTHFKAGFLGVKPDFEEERVYAHGIMKQLRYHYLRTRAMLQSPGYFNSSLWDTLSGEYFRSFTEKGDYYHIFDYWRWDEKLINDTLINQYEWETAVDTKTTWRIGDGTAAFYNYVYYSVAGFTEHDTFRSNQIREGQLTRDEALALCEEENRPRYQNIKWYLDALGADFSEVIKVVNSIPEIYKL